jgi:hypothetical protein
MSTTTLTDHTVIVAGKPVQARLSSALNALTLFPRLGAAPQPIPQSPGQKIRHVVSRSVIRGVARITSST